MFMVETGEGRTPQPRYSVARALRTLSDGLAQLADALEIPADVEGWMDLPVVPVSQTNGKKADHQEAQP